jgi:hypothetical protein
MIDVNVKRISEELNPFGIVEKILNSSKRGIWNGNL